jgi:hypothetical protein
MAEENNNNKNSINAYGILVGKSEGKRPLRRPRRRWEGNIKMDLRERRWDGMDWNLSLISHPLSGMEQKWERPVFLAENVKRKKSVADYA